MGCLVRARELGKAVGEQGEYRAGDFVDHIYARALVQRDQRARARIWSRDFGAGKYLLPNIYPAGKNRPFEPGNWSLIG